MRYPVLATLAGVALIALVSLVPLRAASTPEPAHVVVRGTLVGRSGTPIPDALISFFGFPPGSDGGDNQERYMAVTDARGRFTWTPPQSEDVWVTQAQPHLDIYAALLDGALARSPQEMPAPDPQQADQMAEDSLRTLARKCVATWSDPGSDPSVRLVVPDPGDVVLGVRLPNGKPAASRNLTLVRGDLVDADVMGTVIVWNVRTRKDGSVELRSFPDVMRLQVLMPGAGFGASGLFRIQPNRTTTADLPRLAPFGSIAGQVAASLRRPGSKVLLDPDGGNQSWCDLSAPVATDGSYRIDGVVPGDHGLTYVVQNSTVAGFTETTVAPGQTRGGVNFVRRVPISQIAALKRPESISLDIHGRVVDQAGNPIAGATVAALYYKYRPETVELANPFPSLLAATTRTGSDGSYEFSDLDATAATIAARAGGYAPAWQGIPAQETETRSNDAGEKFKVDAPDIALSDDGGRLAIHVTNGDAPTSGALVELSPSAGMPQVFTFPFLSPSAETKAVQTWFEPISAADANGDAHFADLAPGLWDAIAVGSSDPSDLYSVDSSSFDPQYRVPTCAFADAVGIAVRRGEARRFALRLAKHAKFVDPLVLSPSGHIQDLGDVQWTIERAAKSDSDGPRRVPTSEIAEMASSRWGIWRMTATGHGSGRHYESITDPPTRIGCVYVASSPVLGHQAPPIIRTWSHGPATLRVRLVDDKGKPVPGSVLVSADFNNGVPFGGSTDHNGDITLHGLPIGQFEVAASSDTPSAIMYMPFTTNPMPPDLNKGPRSVFIPQTVTTDYDQTLDLTMQERTIGYLSGKILLPYGWHVKPLYVDADSNSGVPLYDVPLNSSCVVSKDGTFICGPVLSGTVSLSLEAPPVHAGGESEVLTTIQTTFDPEHPSHLLIAPTAADIAAASKAATPDVQQMEHPIRGVVLLPDGKTPAWGAQIAVIYPDAPVQPPIASMGVDGHILALDSPWDARQYLSYVHGPASSPIAVAWLPGSYGAVTAPFVPGRPLRLVLPGRATLRGTVTVAGQYPASSGSTFLVRAAYVGSPALSQLLSVNATADGDGSFELSGLTAGTYTVQAARDGIWLSQTQTIHVSQGLSPAAVHVDIPAPGAPAVLRLRATNGMPLVGASVTLDLPAGPLTDIFWPKTLTADAHGNLIVPGLSAGPHVAMYTAASNGQPKSEITGRISFVVSPLDAVAPVAEAARR